MATTDTNVPQVIVNKLTSAEYATATKSPTEFYAVTDGQIGTSDIANGAVTAAKIDFSTIPTESYTIADTDWTALSASSPYDYSATVTATYTIGANTIAELINDQPVLFGNYGFAIGSISGQTVTIYSIGAPSASVTLKINYKG